MEPETCIFIRLALRVLVKVVLQRLLQTGFVLIDDFCVVGFVAKRVKIVERLVGSCKRNAVCALVVGEGSGAVALCVVPGVALGAILQ